MKKLILLIIAISLFSCKKEEVKPNNEDAVIWEVLSEYPIKATIEGVDQGNLPITIREDGLKFYTITYKFKYNPDGSIPYVTILAYSPGHLNVLNLDSDLGIDDNTGKPIKLGRVQYTLTRQELNSINK